MFSKVVELPLKSLQLTGLNPKHESWIEKIKAFITCSTLTAISIAVMIEICTTEEFTIFTITPKAETIVALSQGVTRSIALFIYKDTLIEMIDESKRFWDVDDEDPNRDTDARTTLQWIWRGMKIYRVCLFGSSIPVVGTAVFVWGESLPFVAWFPKNIACGYIIVYIMEVLFVFATLCLMLGMDGLFAAFSGQLMAQYKLLSRRLENTDHIKNDNEFKKNLENCVEYHLRLLNFGEKLGDVFMGLLFVQYLTTVATSCIELCLMSKTMYDFTRILKFVVYMSTIVSQMAIFCFLSEAVTDESINVSLAVYSSDWHSRHIKSIGIYVQMIIIRAINPTVFTAGGLLIMGRRLWLNIFKVSVSIATLLTSFK